MKKLAIISLAVLSTAVFAGEGDRRGHNGGGNNSDPCTICETNGVLVNAPQIQITATKGTAVLGVAKGSGAYANNNLSSNTYGVRLEADSTQITALKDSAVVALSMGDGAKSSNNLASNIGNVVINDKSLQVVAGKGSFYGAIALGSGAKVVNNASANNACVTCQ